MTHTEFRDKKNKKNIDMVTQIETLFIYMFDEEFFTCNSFLYASLFYTHLEELPL